jgi:hypothetical protein
MKTVYFRLMQQRPILHFIFSSFLFFLVLLTMLMIVVILSVAGGAS